MNHAGEFAVDDDAATRAFMAGLSPRLRKLRFPVADMWRPDHVVIALRDGRPVAMADCLLSPDGSIGCGALVAHQGFGPYAVRAMLRMKMLFPTPRSEVALTEPTRVLVRIGFRYTDFVHDQEAWALSQRLLAAGADRNYAMATPLIATSRNLRELGLPKIAALGRRSRLALAEFCASADTRLVQSAQGRRVPDQIAMALAMDAAALPFRDRQKIARHLILHTGRSLGAVVEPKVANKLFRPRLLPHLQERVVQGAGAAPDEDAPVLVCKSR